MVANYAIDADWSICVQPIARRVAPCHKANVQRSLERVPKFVSSHSCPIYDE